ncbi:MAG TPA: CAP domain-containing protein [Pirellulales bacterium]|jgi:uncharacterized protein YkwD|nr:CAP domain-containing protein [Pirellulales bacterium]
MLLMKGIAVAAMVLLLADGAAPSKTPTKAPTNPPAKPATRSAPKATHAAFTLHPVEQSVVAQTNAERARHGLPPLAVDQRLVQSARAHTAWMSRARRLQHTSRPVAENIAMGQQTALDAVRSWMSSSGHRANILSRGHRRIGVSAYAAPDGTVFWTQQFEP